MSPFSKAGKQLGNGDDRDLFPRKLSAFIQEILPRAVVFEKRARSSRRSILQLPQSAAGEPERARVFVRLATLVNASDYGTPQQTSRYSCRRAQRNWLVASFGQQAAMCLPRPLAKQLFDLMAERGMACGWTVEVLGKWHRAHPCRRQ